MSAKYSISPTLYLKTAESHLYMRCQGLLIAAVALALFELMLGGYYLLVMVLGTCLLCFLRFSWQQRPVGAVIRWQQGEWTLESGGQVLSIALRRGHCLPWLTFVAWQAEPGKKGQVWLFNDSAPYHDLRRLRVRLRIERGV